MKKTLALFLALLMLMSGFIVAFASKADANYEITTAFFAENADGEWEEITSVPAESKVKMRVSIRTNFVSGPATLLFAYDKEVVSPDFFSSTSSTSLTVNEDFELSEKIQRISGAIGTTAASKQLGLGNITPEQYNAYGFIVASILTNGCFVYDSSEWLFEIDMTVLKGAKGKSLECFIIPETVCTTENTQGYVTFPYTENAEAGLGSLESAFNWYENTPVLNSKKAEITASLNERRIAFVVDGTVKKTDYYSIGDEVSNDFIPEKKGYVFAGWEPSIPETMPDENITVNATWAPATDTKYLVHIYKKYGNSYGLASETYYTGTTGETVTADCSAPEGFYLNTEKSNVSGVIRADGSLVLKVYFDRNTYTFTSVVDGAETSADYLYGESIAIPETPEKEGYVFAGWEPSIPSAMPAYDLTVNATWISADDVAYTVETYTMGTDGEYALSSKVAYEGTTGETVTAEYVVPEGFKVDGENSTFSGVVAADGSLVLKVYIFRCTYKFTSVVDGVETSAFYLYGQTVAAPAAPSKQGYVFTGWSAQVPETMPANDVTLTARFSCTATVSIKNNPGSKTIKYGETLRLTAETANAPEGAKIFWFVDGAKKGEGTTFEVSPSSGTVEVTVKLVDSNGNDYAEGGISDSQKVSVNSGFFQKIISFFKNLFGMNRTIVQMIFR